MLHISNRVILYSIPKLAQSQALLQPNSSCFLGTEARGYADGLLWRIKNLAIEKSLEGKTQEEKKQEKKKIKEAEAARLKALLEPATPASRPNNVDTEIKVYRRHDKRILSREDYEMLLEKTNKQKRRKKK